MTHTNCGVRWDVSESFIQCFLQRNRESIFSIFNLNVVAGILNSLAVGCTYPTVYINVAQQYRTQGFDSVVANIEGQTLVRNMTPLKIRFSLYQYYITRHMAIRTLYGGRSEALEHIYDVIFDVEKQEKSGTS